VVPLYVERFSDWKRLYRATATFLLYLDILRARCKAEKLQKILTLEQLTSAKNLLFRKAQQDNFKSELGMRTQGRLDTINQSRDQIVLPKRHHITQLIVKEFHETNHHASRGNN